MVLLKWIVCFNFLFLLGCQIPYLTKTAYNHLNLMSKRQDIEKVIKSKKLSQKQVEKLQLAVEARKFAENHLGLTTSNNYTQYAQLDRPYVSYIVTASPKFQMKAHKWWFPFVGEVPYKGFASKQQAQQEADNFNPKIFDTYVRGASAYSTLGWFDDPILTSHLNYSDHDLVNLIIHETVHVTIYINSNASFNERLATFIGNKGTEQFFLQKEGRDSKTVSLIKKQLHDDKLFSEFISKEVNRLEKWYNDHKNKLSEAQRLAQFKRIQDNFKTSLQPKFKLYKMDYFLTEPLNNAKLMALKTYIYDMQDFERAHKHFDSNFKKFVAWAKTLEDSKKPELKLKNLTTKKTATR